MRPLRRVIHPSQIFVLDVIIFSSLAEKLFWQKQITIPGDPVSEIQRLIFEHLLMPFVSFSLLKLRVREHRDRIFQIFKKVGSKLYEIFFMT